MVSIFICVETYETHQYTHIHTLTHARTHARTHTHARAKDVHKKRTQQTHIVHIVVC